MLRIETSIGLFVIVAICAISTNCFACQSRTVSVVGSAEQELVPDEIWIPLRVSTEAKTLALAMDEFQKISGRLNDTFNAMDFPDLKIDANGRIVSNQPPQQANRQQIIMAGNIDQSPPARIYVFEKIVFKGNMQTQIGFDFHWRSSYTAMGYDPAIQQYYVR